MCSLNQYITITKLKEKYKKSKLLPLLIRIYEVTNGLSCKSTLRLSNEEKALLIEECSLGEFNPSWMLMNCFGSMLPEVCGICQAVEKFRDTAGLVILVIVNKKISLINIEKS